MLDESGSSKDTDDQHEMTGFAVRRVVTLAERNEDDDLENQYKPKSIARKCVNIPSFGLLGSSNRPMLPPSSRWSAVMANEKP